MVRVDLDDVNYLIGDLWCGRSAYALAGDAAALRAEAQRDNAGKNATRKGTWRDLRPLCLVRRVLLRRRGPPHPSLLSRCFRFALLAVTAAESTVVL